MHVGILRWDASRGCITSAPLSTQTKTVAATVVIAVPAVPGVVVVFHLLGSVTRKLIMFCSCFSSTTGKKVSVKILFEQQLCSIEITEVSRTMILDAVDRTKFSIVYR